MASEKDDEQAQTSEKLSLLKHQRGIAKRNLTRLEKFIQERLSNSSIFEIDTRLSFLDGYNSEFMNLQSQIEILEKLPEDDDETRGNFEDRFIAARVRLLQAKSELSIAETSQFNQTMPSPHVSFVEAPADFSNIKLPSFGGDYYKWPEFEDAVNKMLTENTSRGMTNLKRFIILRAALSGAALTAIENLKLTEENYEIALERLKSRFYKKKLIFDSYVTKIFQLPRINDTKSLRNVTDNALSCFKQLESFASKDELIAGFVCHIILSKCDEEIVSKWEELWAGETTLPHTEDLIEFLDSHATKKETVELSIMDSKGKATKTTKKSYFGATNERCALCDDGCKSFLVCTKFLKMSPKQRFFFCNKHKVCRKCLVNAYGGCNCDVKCKICKQGHHELLHLNQFRNAEQSKSADASSFDDANISSSTVNGSSKPNSPHDKPCTSKACQNINVCANSKNIEEKYTFIATAIVLVKSNAGHWIPLRCLLDSGSQINAITKKAIKRLRLRPKFAEVAIEGFGGKVSNFNQEVSFTLRSTTTEGALFDVDAVVIHDIPGRQPTKLIDVSQWNLPNNVQLADNKFFEPASVDIIIGAGLMAKISCVGEISLGESRPVIQKTLFGWIILGETTMPYKSSVCALSSFLLASTRSSDEAAILNKFWELEECTNTQVNIQKFQSPVEQFCEQFFQRTVKRNETGRVSVKLPFVKSPNLLGLSYKIALSRLLSIEAKLKKSPNFQKAYARQLEEYLEMGHMSEVELDEAEVFLPHFYVLKLESSTTPLRIVFDASCPTSTGLALNDVLAVGPVIQRTLFTNLICFRFPLIGVSADIVKMYRQVSVCPEDRKYQCILWRDANGTVKAYSLNTVTFGTAPASFLACRAMVFLANEENDLPLGAEVVKTAFYVDNALFGDDSPSLAIQKLRETRELLMRGEMPLKKIMSNSPEVLQAFPDSELDDTLKLDDDEVIKTLGLFWNPKDDVFRYDVKVGSERITKRQILSETARIFDPLGFAQPVVITAKIINQQVCRLSLGWDESVTMELHTVWERFRTELVYLKQIALPRCVMVAESKSVQIHGFCDASLKAYAAAVYVRVEDSGGNITVRLLASKTRVAPLKVVTLARLELCGALLLARLLHALTGSEESKYVNARFFAWSDSMTALRWIADSPSRWVQFVANRVSEIQRLVPYVEWRHVPGVLNPADVASRGLWPSELVKNIQWFNGAEFLHKHSETWPQSQALPDEVPDEKKFKFGLLALSYEPDPIVTCKFESWRSIHRTMSYVAKFILKCQKKYISAVPTLATVSLNSQDLRNGELIMVKFVQIAIFSQAIEEWQATRTISDNRLKSLRPFMDEQNILRVGGRLNLASDISYETKHPAILPAKHRLTKLLFQTTHRRLGHAGPNALFAEIRLKYWPVKGKVIANKTVRECLICRKVKPITFQQVMGSLPSERITQTPRPFTIIGVDLGGYLTVHYKGRGSRTEKVYFAIFVDFPTKAVHIELVENLTTEAFINALKRFCSIRGTPKQIWCDNGTNFHGCANLFREIDASFDPSKFWQAVYEWSATEKLIDWHFIPPRSPHFSGLMEAGVKLAKHHLTRIAGNACLTKDELMTLLAEISAILNNRPIIPISLNPEDEMPLTPAHFLIGQPYGSLLEPNLHTEKISSLKRWQLLASLKQSFWLRWNHDYLITLQQRSKWTIELENPKINDLVLVVDKKTLSQTWSMGRIIEVHPSKDGKVRVATVKTATGEYKRAITELCPLPIESNED